MAKLVSKVYGDALFEAALEKQELDALFEEVSVLIPIFRENQNLVQLLGNPRISRDEKQGIIKELFEGRISESLMGFFTIIVEKDRQKDILAILEYFAGRVREYKKIGAAYVTSATVLNAEQKAALEKKLLETTPYVRFEMNYAVDESLIGGMVVRIGDRIVDSSIRTRLDKLKKELSKLQLA